MTSLRIDPDKDLTVWAKRFDKLLTAAVKDGVEFTMDDFRVSASKDGMEVDMMVWEGEYS